MMRIGMAVVLACVASPALADEPVRKPPAPAPAPAPKPAKPPTAATPAKPLPPMDVTIESHKALSATSLTPAAVAAKVEASYTASIRRCYGEQLARTPGGKGKLVLRFQVTARGDVEAVRASSFDRRLDTCVAGQAVAWRFPIPASQTGAPATAGFEIAFQLRPDAPELAEEGTVLADLMTGDPGSTHNGSMGRRPAGSDLAAQIDAIRNSGKHVTTGSAGGGAAGQPAPAPAPSPAGRAQLSRQHTDGGSSLTLDAVAAKILSAYMAGIKRCYHHRLKQDPKARGRVALELEVGEAGRVTRHDARGFDASIDACIEQFMPSWRFPVPKDKAGEPTAASFGLALELVAE
jgi:outer membrane biosynthesis protein TonB